MIDFTNSRPLSISEYESLISEALSTNPSTAYAEMAFYIQHNFDLALIIENNLSLNKKLFNAIQKSNLSKICLITEPWCLDACVILPLMKAIAVINPAIQLEIYTRDTNLEIMNQFLTNGSQSIPIVFGVNSEGKEAFRWGPRSALAKEIITPLKDEGYKIKQKALTDFYQSDLTNDIQKEWIDLNLG